MPTLNETFSVSAADHAWSVISDLNQLVPCVPGARVATADGPDSVPCTASATRRCPPSSSTAGRRRSRSASEATACEREVRVRRMTRCARGGLTPGQRAVIARELDSGGPRHQLTLARRLGVRPSVIRRVADGC